MIDVNLQTDLANKEERDKIRDAKDKVKDVAITVKNVIDKGNVGGIKENYVNNRFATRGANAVEDDPKLSKALENFETLSPEQKYTVMLKLADTMYKANGFDKGPNIIVTDTKDTQRGLDTGTIYINLEQLSSFSAGDLVNAIAHESSHSEVLGESEESFAIEKGDRAKDKFDSPKDTEKVDLDGYLDTLEGEYTKEKIRLAEVKEKLPEEEGEELSIKEALETKDIRIIGLVTVSVAISEVHSYAYNNNPKYKNLVDEGIIKFEEGRVYLRGKLIEGFEWTIENISNLISSASTTNSKESVKEEEKDKKEESKGNTNKDKEKIKGDKTSKGREYTEHGADRANEREFSDEAIDNIIDNNKKTRKKEVDKDGKITWRYQDKRGNTVITNENGDKIVTVYSYPQNKNDGNYIPKN